jgi:hypothetical protein
MSTDNAGSATTQESSGSTETTNQDKVAYETYKRVLSEAKKLKEQLKTLEEEKTRTHESKLKEQNEWKTLAESYKGQLDQTKAVLVEQEQSIVNGMKYQEFEKHLGGRLKNKDYATFIDFDKIVMNPETKRIDDESVKGVISEFVKNHYPLVEFSGGARVPNEAARAGIVTGGKKIEEMTARELEDFIKNQAKAGLIK